MWANFFEALRIFELDFVLILSPEGKVPGSILAAARPSNIFCLINLILGMMNKRRFTRMLKIMGIIKLKIKTNLKIMNITDNKD